VSLGMLVSSFNAYSTLSNLQNILLVIKTFKLSQSPTTNSRDAIRIIFPFSSITCFCNSTTSSNFPWDFISIHSCFPHFTHLSFVFFIMATTLSFDVFRSRTQIRILEVSKSLCNNTLTWSFSIPIVMHHIMHNFMDHVSIKKWINLWCYSCELFYQVDFIDFPIWFPWWSTMMKFPLWQCKPPTLRKY